MEISFYNHFFISGGNYFVYSSLTNSLHILTEKLYNLLLSLKNHSENYSFDSLPNDVLRKLKLNKIIVESNKIEYSGANCATIPEQTVPLFRSKLRHDSGQTAPLIPEQTAPLFE
jgi:hypothetical protein